MTEVWPSAVRLETSRLVLEPLRVGHAAEMSTLLHDPALYEFIGGEPATEEQLRDRYRRQVDGHSPDGSQGWLNWVLRRCDGGNAIGTVQATLTAAPGRAGTTAEVAWIVGTAQQRQGYAREAATATVAWLRSVGVATVIAHVHPGHASSIAVAEAVGLQPTGTVVDGEVRYQG